MNHWTDYRWDEAALCLISHSDYVESMDLDSTIISRRFADFSWSRGLYQSAN